MSNRIIKITTVLTLLSLLFFFTPVTAKNLDKSEILPEEEGIYNVPNHPGLKLKVFVYREKPAKPGKPAPSYELYCPITDDNTPTAEVAWAGWKLPSTINYWLNPGSVPSSVGSLHLNTITDNSFAVWESEAGVAANAFGTTSVNRAVQDGQWLVTWGRISASALAMTYVWYYPDTGKVVEIDTIMNQKYYWMWSNPVDWHMPAGQTCAYTNAYDAQNILTHEIGHWFGLNDHKTAEYSQHTMYGYGATRETKKDTLTTGDVNGIKAIY